MFLGLDASEWTAVGTMATAVVALVAAGFAFAQVREARRTREDQIRPFVVVDLQPSRAWGNALNLVVENIGRTLARDVRLEFDPGLSTTMDDQYPIGESSLVRDGIAMMPPGRRIEALFDLSHERHKTELPNRYDVTVQLHDARGRRQEPQRYVIDITPLYGLTRITEYGVHDAAKALREMQKSMKKWSDIHGRLKVWVRDEDRDRMDERAHHFLTGNWRTMASPSPPDFLLALARNSFARAVLGSIKPLHRWVQARLN